MKEVLVSKLPEGMPLFGAEQAHGFEKENVVRRCFGSVLVCRCKAMCAMFMWWGCRCWSLADVDGYKEVRCLLDVNAGARTLCHVVRERMMMTLTQCGGVVAQMSVYEGFTHLSGGKFCHGGLEETASQLLWCEHCGVALCFDCDSHCHHAKNARSTHLRVLLPSSRTSSVPRCEHGSNPTVGEDHHYLVPQAWRRASVRGGLSASSLDDLVSGQSISSSKDKRKRNRKKEKSLSSPLSQKESFKGYESLGKKESKSVPPCESATEQNEVACDDGGVVAGEDVDNFVLESDISDISLSSSPELGSPILLRTVSLSVSNVFSYVLMGQFWAGCAEN